MDSTGSTHPPNRPEAMKPGDFRALARAISLVENEGEKAWEFLEQLTIVKRAPLIGITGPPGAGKSSLLNALCRELFRSHPEVRVGVIAVDPTSPYTHGALLGDRLRLSEHFTNPSVFIRSVATRGALGGLSARTLEIAEVMQASGFDYLFIETVGVGQSEVEVASVADITVVVVVPESGDEIQMMKSGIMEIADIFVVNKADRDGADTTVKNLLHGQSGMSVPVLKTVAVSGEGISALIDAISKVSNPAKAAVHDQLLMEKALRLARHYAVRNLDINTFKEEITRASREPGFSIFSFISGWFHRHPAR